VSNRVESGDVVVCWSASPRAPVTVVREGGAAILWGEAIPGPGPERIDAGGLFRAWSPAFPRGPFPAFDGFHAAFCVAASGDTAVGADVLGNFPVYYAQLDGAVLIGTSPTLFTHHPAFRFELDARGLAGYFLLGHIANEVTLVRGVRLLTPGKVLVVDRQVHAVERDQYAVPTTDAAFDLPFEAHVERLHDAISRAFRRHVVAGRPHAFMMSGGLDSRLLAGYLDRLGTGVSAVTMGEPRDVEARAARAAAKALRWPHRIHAAAASEHPRNARLVASVEHLAGGFNSIGGWGLREIAPSLPAYLVSGHVVDVVLGGADGNWVMSEDPNPLTFDKWFADFNKWGLSPDRLKTLLRWEGARQDIEAVLETLRATYASLGPRDSQRAWRLELRNRSRLHVGSAFWRASFGVWPVRPVVDREVLEAVGGMPLATLGGRRAEIALVSRAFPRLADIPVDRASSISRPLRPRLGWLLRHAAQNRLDALGRRLGRPPRRGVYFQRQYDFDSPRWHATRLMGEPARAAAERYLDAGMLRELLPPPGVRVAGRDRVLGGTTPKALLGFFCWLGANGMSAPPRGAE
jgi:asparagine synthase (glutamine-hydrolysing)